MEKEEKNKIAVRIHIIIYALLIILFFLLPKNAIFSLLGAVFVLVHGYIKYPKNLMIKILFWLTILVFILYVIYILLFVIYFNNAWHEL